MDEVKNIEVQRKRGRPPKDGMAYRATVRLDEDHYNKIARKMKAERRATIADTVRVILIEYFERYERFC